MRLGCRALQLGLAWLMLLLPAIHAAGTLGEEVHWAYRSRRRPPTPAVEQRDWVRTPVDAFVLAKLETRGLSPSPPADALTLRRRLSLLVTGLPPSPGDDELDTDTARIDDSYELLIERLLASPQFGPRWGKYWLDVSGYADSNGYFSADTDRPWAWRYRDYVIASHNADRSFAQFIREQLAGDELSGYEPGKTVSSEMLAALIATHYLRNAPDGTGESDGNPDEVRVDRYTVLEGTAQILGASLFGLTMQCSKCHDHKFESFTQREYYQLQAIFYPAYHVEQWLKPNDRVTEINSQKISWLTDPGATAPKVRLLVRGDPKQPGEVVEPDVPAILRDERFAFRVAPAPGGRTTGRRAALAQWITASNSRSAALVSRVTVNRLWQQVFGVGIVATPENLGVTGAPPTHEELLEYLADEFQQSDWSVKHVLRLILQSNTFRQSAVVRPSAAELDPSNRLLSRFPLRRLDAEAVRDGLLAVSGELDLRLNGPYVPTKRAANGEVAVEESNAGLRRRSVYLQQRRTQIESLLGTFDAPSIVNSCPKRAVTTTPVQSLWQLNSHFVRKRAEQFADAVIAESADTDARLRFAFERLAGRPPLAEETETCRSFLAEQQAEYGGADGARRVWIDLCQILLASNEFVYVD